VTSSPPERPKRIAYIHLGACDGKGKFWAGDEWQMHVTDENRRTLFKLRFSSEETEERAAKL
jgi:hypothetical protein